ncbi:MAG: glycosyltransferase family 4 protein [Pseudomonadota bacterium]
MFVAPSAYLLGGVQVWLDYLLVNLNSNGWKCQLALVNGKFHDAKAYLKAHPFDDVVLVESVTQTHWGRVQALSNVIEAAQPQLVVNVNIADTYIAMADIKAQSSLAPRFMPSIHGLEPQFFCDLAKYRDIIDGVLVTNRLTERVVAELADIETQKIFYAPYGVSNSIVSSNKVSNNFTVLYAGRLENQQKRCADLVSIISRLAKKLKGVRFIIAGEGPYRQSLETALTNHMDVNQFEFLGNVDRTKLLAEILPLSNALLITSQWETGPIVAWEAMAAGVPVVSSRYLGLAEERALAHEQNCLLFDVGDVEHASDHLAKLYDQKLRLKIIKNAFSLIESRYTVSRSVELAALAFDTVLCRPDTNAQKLPPQVSWQTKGKIEFVFGARLGNFVRRFLRLPAKTFAAGDEWPHSMNLGGDVYSKMKLKLDKIFQKSR